MSWVDRADLQLRLAPNPGPMTLTGTNTWILGDPAEAPVWVVDPGPADGGHLAAVMAAAVGRVDGVVLTHRHLDHAEAAPLLAAQAGCGVRSADPALLVDASRLVDGEVVTVGSVRVEVVSTPGHTSDSVCLVVDTPDGSTWLLSGDTVLGRGTTVITHPDGDLEAYLISLDRLQQLVAERGVRAILPGHGPVVTDPAGVLAGYRAHRLERLDQVRAAVADGATTAADVVARVYAAVDRSLWPAAEQSVRAQLDYLRGRGGDSPKP